MSTSRLGWFSNDVQVSNVKSSLGKHFARKISVFNPDKKVGNKHKKNK